VIAIMPSVSHPAHSLQTGDLIAFQPVILDCHVVALNVAGFVEALPRAAVFLAESGGRA
jgi:hypothetical protein